MKISLIKMVTVWCISLLFFYSCNEKKVDNSIWADKDNSFVLSIFSSGYFSCVTYKNSQLNSYIEGKWMLTDDSIKFYSVINEQNNDFRAQINGNKIHFCDKDMSVDLYRKDSEELLEKFDKKLLIIKDSFYVKKCTLIERRYYSLIEKILNEKDVFNIPGLMDCLCIELDSNKILISFIRKEKISSKITGYEFINNHLVAYFCDKSFLKDSDEVKLFYQCTMDGGDGFVYTDDEEYFVSYAIKNDSLVESFRTFKK